MKASGCHVEIGLLGGYDLFRSTVGAKVEDIGVTQADQQLCSLGASHSPLAM
jgi:hypothetical protein